MKIDVFSKLKKDIFINNLCIIIGIFSVLCLFTADKLEHSVIKKQYYNVSKNNFVGPVIIDKKSAIYKIEAYYSGKNSSEYISVEVLDENQDTLYEFGKDLWEEEGYDADGHWSEGDRKMKAYITFSEKGKYYLLFNPDDNANAKISNNIQVTIYRLKASYIPHLEMGTILLILLLIFWLRKNRDWFKGEVWDKFFDWIDLEPKYLLWIIPLFIFCIWVEAL